MSSLFFYKMIFCVEVLVAEFLFTFRLKKRKHFALNYAAACAVCIAFSAAYPVNFDAADTVWYSSLMFLAVFAVTIPALCVCFDERAGVLFFCAIAAYTTQHFAYELANLALSLALRGRSPLLGMYTEESIALGANAETLMFVLGYLMCYLAAYSLMYFFFARRIRRGCEMRIKSKSLMFLIAAGLLADIVLNAVLAYNAGMDLVSEVISYVTNMLCCVLLLYSQFGLLQTGEVNSELELVRRLRSQEREQYELSKANIDLINMKCHDMRHQLREIGRSRSMPEDAIREMERAISVYDAMVQTGNEALDTLLTEKSLRCAKEGVRLTCIADGGALSFMRESDLYSLFGNAMDNAIDAVLRLDGSRRTIGLKIHRTGELVAISVRNPYDGEVTFGEDGFPVTTKGSADYHGFGVRSMAQTAEKYGGNVSVTAKGGVFALNIVIPVPENKGEGAARAQ